MIIRRGYARGYPRLCSAGWIIRLRLRSACWLRCRLSAGDAVAASERPPAARGRITMAGPPAEGFGALLRQRRHEAGLTQEELAAAATLSPRSVSDLERG